MDNSSITRLNAALAGRYTLERELGRGGMGAVYLALDLKHDRQLALKVLRQEVASAVGAERFLREIRITARLDHPHILTLIDSGESDGFLWYALPYVRGESLRARLDREKQLPIDEALAITRQVASALEHAHRHGVVHRDIKPANILLHEGEAMVADFGIALALSEAGGDRLTESGLAVGTPQYMSPEQATGHRDLDARTDVYGLGAVLYEMLAGEPPFTGATAQAMIAKLLTERPTRLGTVRNTVPQVVDDAVVRSLAKIPADRFPSAVAFADALQEEPRRRRPIGVRALRWLLVLGGVAAAILFAVTAWQARRRQLRATSVLLERTRLTYSGSASSPVFSPDGKRMAYAEGACGPDGSCGNNIVIQDVGGVGVTAVASGLQAGVPIDWTADGRHLLLSDFPNRRWDAFAVSTLGGPVRHLGCCRPSLLGRSDTVLLGRFPYPADTLSWVRLVTITDGVARDSVPVRHASGTTSVDPYGAPDGHRIAVVVDGTHAGSLILVIDRVGTLRDSLVVEGGAPIWAHGSRALLLAMWRHGRREELDLVRYRVSDEGRVGQAPDTLMVRLEAVGLPHVGPDGALAFAGGAQEATVWSLRREDSRSMRFTPRRLATGPGVEFGEISPDGKQVLIMGRVAGANAPTTSLAVMPFDSGPLTPVGLPIGDIEVVGWSADGHSAFLLSQQSENERTIIELELASGRRRAVASYESRDGGFVFVVPGGGLLLAQRDRTLRRLAVPGLRDTAILMPNRIVAVDVAPDGRMVALAGWNTNQDSLLLFKMSIASGALTPPQAIAGGRIWGLRWMLDGSLVVPMREAWGFVLYRVDSVRGGAERVGDIPLEGTAWRALRISRDGRRAVATVSDYRTDIYVIRGFGDLLRR